MLDKFIKELENGWDYGVEWFESTFGKNKYTELYWSAYDYCKGGDYDGGICFKMRECAIEELTEKLKGK